MLYHFASKEALLEAAIAPAVAEFEEVLDDYLGGRRSDRRRILVDRVVDMLLSPTARPCTSSSSRARACPSCRSSSAPTRPSGASPPRSCDERESVADQVRFGIALGGAAFLLTAGRTFTDEEFRPTDAELRVTLLDIIRELLA